MIRKSIFLLTLVITLSLLTTKETLGYEDTLLYGRTLNLEGTVGRPPDALSHELRAAKGRPIQPIQCGLFSSPPDCLITVCGGACPQGYECKTQLVNVPGVTIPTPVCACFPIPQATISPTPSVPNPLEN